jgi:hypothetical protein
MSGSALTGQPAEQSRVRRSAKVTQGMVLMIITPDIVTALIRSETDRIGRIVKLSGATVE